MAKKNRVKSLIINVFFVVLCVAIAFVVSNLLFITVPVKGSSMETTLHGGDRITLYKLDKEYRHGDIVVFNTHKINIEGDEQHLVKRIIGLPGDTIEIVLDQSDDNYYVYRNGEKVIEDYLDGKTKLTSQQARITVNTGEFYYLGDNRQGSDDSRNGQMGKLDDILGRVIVRYNPDIRNFNINLIKRV